MCCLPKKCPQIIASRVDVFLEKNKRACSLIRELSVVGYGQKSKSTKGFTNNLFLFSSHSAFLLIYSLIIKNFSEQIELDPI